MDGLDELRHLIRTHPIVDHHAGHLLTRKAALDSECEPLEVIVAADSHRGRLYTVDIEDRLSLRRAMRQLGELYGTSFGTKWYEVQETHDQCVRECYRGLIKKSLEGTHVLFLTDPRQLDQDSLLSSRAHDRFTVLPTKRIAHIEQIAEAQILEIASSERRPDETILNNFRQRFQTALVEAMDDPNIIAFMTDVCHRTGLDVEPHTSDDITLGGSLLRILDSGTVRSGFIVNDKPLCDWLVQQTLKSSYKKSKPLHFETGWGPVIFGDTRTNLAVVNPALLQPLIAQYQGSDIVLLHAAYPYTREAAYLASKFPNLYLGLGLVSPTMSRDGQENVLRQCLEVAPATHLLWGTGGRAHPESFWLATYQFRQVLVDYVQQGDLTVQDAKWDAQRVLFLNSQNLYNMPALRFDHSVSRIF
ncbi:Amidohydrolase 2 [Penicillium sp. DV-2018c]|nr:Amidohydrolase 2 [Penicillium sp. DV-2018c]KAJ5565856.1 Amidohydrolase 2 [Penicillium sp. DV-2018c]